MFLNFGAGPSTASLPWAAEASEGFEGGHVVYICCCQESQYSVGTQERW
jgi:hypothetical protein